MHAEEAGYPVGFKDPAPAQVPGAPGGLLRRLKDQQHVVGQVLLVLEPFRQGQNHGHVAVMATGVHPAGVAGGEGQAGFLCDGQSVGIAAEGDGAGPSKIEKGTQGPGDRGGQGTLHGREDPTEVSQGFRQIPVQLRDLVKSTAMLDHLHKITSLGR